MVAETRNRTLCGRLQTLTLKSRLPREHIRKNYAANVRTRRAIMISTSAVGAEQAKDMSVVFRVAIVSGLLASTNPLNDRFDVSYPARFF